MREHFYSQESKIFEPHDATNLYVSATCTKLEFIEFACPKSHRNASRKQADLAKPFEQDDWNDDAIQELVSRAQSGCADSQQLLFGQLRTYLAFIANEQMETKLKAKLGASDIVQQTLTKAVVGLKDYRGKTAAEFKGWLKQIAVNETRQVKRGFNSDKRQISREQSIAQDSRMSSPALQLADSMMTPGTGAIAEEQSQAIHTALSRLSDEQQHVIKLRNWEGLTFSQIAAQMEVSESSAAKLWYRGLIKLQEEFAAMHEPDQE